MLRLSSSAREVLSGVGAACLLELCDAHRRRVDSQVFTRVTFGMPHSREAPEAMSQNMDERGDFIVRNMSAGEVDLSVKWAALEGWNPGLHDAQCFWAADPDGFFIGEWRGGPGARPAPLAPREELGFLRLCIVEPPLFRQRFGTCGWERRTGALGKPDTRAAGR